MESDSSSPSLSYSSSSSETLSDFDQTQPYLFEPYGSSGDSEPSSGADSDDNSSSQNNVNDRLQNTDWCRCDNCQRLDRLDECVCCQEIECIVNKNYQAVGHEGITEPPTCITQHPGFHAVCLNKWVLQAAWYQYRQQYSSAYDGPEHKKNRHIAYRQLVRWCWGFLGKNIRVSLPSCAVCCIRAHFPPPGFEEDFEFVGFRYADE